MRTAQRRGQPAGLGLVMVSSLLWLLAAQTAAFEFSADRTVKDNGKTVAARIHAQDDRWRLEYCEPQNGAMVMIVRGDRKLAWLLLSKRRIYLEVPMTEAHGLSADERLPDEISRVRVGDEELNGLFCDVFEVTAGVPGHVQRYYQWVSAKERFSVKLVSQDRDWSVEYRNIRFGPQSWRLLEPPYGYSSDRPLSGESEPSIGK